MSKLVHVAIPPWSPDDGIRRVLMVTAHPDDVDYGSAGTVAAFTAAGIEVTYCIATNGEAGGSDLEMSRADMAAVRQEEQRAAAAVVGVDDVRFLGHPDGAVEATVALRRDISRVIRQVQPERIVTQSPDRNWDFILDSHPDHLALGEAAVCAFYPDAQNPFAHPELLRNEGLQPWTANELWLMAPGDPRATVAVETTATLNRKIAALLSHRSQIPDSDGVATWIPEVARSHAQLAGLREGSSAELFRAVRVPWAVEQPVTRTRGDSIDDH
jgi:LmbE family N-acetylglucosaminyl deacetylase